MPPLRFVILIAAVLTAAAATIAVGYALAPDMSRTGLALLSLAAVAAALLVSWRSRR